MSIAYDPYSKVISLHTKNSTYQMQIDRLGTLLHLYYGRPNSGFLDVPVTFVDRSMSLNPNNVGTDRTYSLDTLPLEYPALGAGDYRHCALEIENADGSQYCVLTYAGHRILEGKYALEGLPAVWAATEEAQTLEVTLEDPASGLEVKLLYGVLPDLDVITRSAILTNKGKETLTIKKAAAGTLDFVTGNYDLLTFYGRHAFERQKQRTPVSHGVFSVASRRGSSSHQYNPATVLALPGTTEENGECWGMCFCYSGNFLFEAEKDQYDQTRLTMGLNTEFFAYPLEPGKSFTVPEVIMTYSRQGFSRLSANYHTCIRKHVCRGKYALAPRPVVLNSWEAAFFDFDGQTIIDLAEQAQKLGIDMVVMDDGWFGTRTSDNMGLGDWIVNEQKLGMTLGELVCKVNDLGVQFGIWIEPEMINEDSDLYRAHPDWAITAPGRKPVRGRNQLVLDFSRKEIRDHIFDSICAVLDQGNIQYVKWDMNRSLNDLYNGSLAYDYVLGVYEFLQRLVDRYPNILIEGCAGGGGRFDAGMLYYTPQIWCSDDTDAIARTKIQYGTSFFYPMSAISAHVSTVPNQQTGRTASIHTRGVTAMTGAFGYELDPAHEPEADLAQIKRQVRFYKRMESLISDGLYYRLSDPETQRYAAWESVWPDGSQALLSVVELEAQANAPRTFVRMRGLTEKALYLDETHGRFFTGAVLMEIGYPLPLHVADYEGWQIVFRRCDEAEALAHELEDELKKTEGRLVVGICGCSGCGKSTIASALTATLEADGVTALHISGNDYARRNTDEVRAQRKRIYENNDIQGLREYVGSPLEVSYDTINKLIQDFHNGDKMLKVTKLCDGSEETLDAQDAQILIVDWTHVGNEHVRGIDRLIYMEIEPDKILERSDLNGRKEDVSEVKRKVLGIEQEMLADHSKNAWIIVGEDHAVKKCQ